ncbi:hypothetical protein C882_1351 [Caenispirillum salinarum AK4]|uniref:Uncharacterized protein n=1 Tax=Caenispirillum salinarum AK4 TaxID=1238182 RepID=K9GNF0_9PROT|nr:hypothetical protein [Caenispirillum salinarum]EKV27505.1 hypothetical protein C882_1351 [Caenispirillum salinarum AK4]
MTRKATSHYEGKILGQTTRLFRRIPYDDDEGGGRGKSLTVSPLDLPPALVYQWDNGEGGVMTDPVEVARYAMHHEAAHVRVAAVHPGER